MFSTRPTRAFSAIVKPSGNIVSSCVEVSPEVLHDPADEGEEAAAAAEAGHLVAAARVRAQRVAAGGEGGRVRLHRPAQPSPGQVRVASHVTLNRAGYNII